jgi:predicted transcriptional regulator
VNRTPPLYHAAPTPLKVRVLRAVRAALWPLSTPEIAALTGAARGAVWGELAALHRAGVLRRVNGAKRRGPKVTRWRLAGAGARGLVAARA